MTSAADSQRAAGDALSQTTRRVPTVHILRPAHGQARIGETVGERLSVGVDEDLRLLVPFDAMLEPRLNSKCATQTHHCS